MRERSVTGRSPAVARRAPSATPSWRRFGHPRGRRACGERSSRTCRASWSCRPTTPLGAAREGIDGADALQPYVRAFGALDVDAAHLLVAETGGAVVATMQLNFIPGLARRGALRAQVEGVRVRADLRNSGLGRALVLWARSEAGRRGCALIQLTSDKQRPEAHRFYSQLGFTASHEGFTLDLSAEFAGFDPSVACLPPGPDAGAPARAEIGSAGCRPPKQRTECDS